MKKIFILFLFIGFITKAQAQKKEDEAERVAAAEFEKLYNANTYNAVFALFSDELRKILPPAKTYEFVSLLKAQAGNILQREFVKYDGDYAVYKTKFERGTWELKIAASDERRIWGIHVDPYPDESLPKITRNTTKIALPFKGEWDVVWGGDTRKLNYHIDNWGAQKKAFDILIKDARGQSYRTNGRTNKDYYAFGQDLLAPCPGEVILVNDGVRDNVPGVINTVDQTGNSVIIKTAAGEYLLLAHFKQFSIVVKKGQQVKPGDLLGLCGNSGHSSEPHLHFQLQNGPDTMGGATSVKCYFDQITVNNKPKTDYSPIKGDKIRNKGY